MPHYKIPIDKMHGYAVKFSPFIPNRLAVAAAQLYTSIGPGALFILNCTDNEHVYQERCYNWRDALLDTVWSKDNLHQVLTSSGDGSLQLWDTSSEISTPVQVFKEHTGEVYSIDWETINQNPQILSGGWDGKVKLWDPTRKNSLITFEHSIDNNNSVSRDTLMIFDVSFSGGHKSLFSSVGTDNYLRIWSLNEPEPVSLIKSSANEILTCDWVEKSEHMLGIGASNGSISIYDLRHSKKEVAVLKSGTESAVRRIKFSSFENSVLASGGYDSVTRVWDLNYPNVPLNAICQHGDCVFGVDWDPFNAGTIADCGWDSIISVFSVKKG